MADKILIGACNYYNCSASLSPKRYCSPMKKLISTLLISSTLTCVAADPAAILEEMSLTEKIGQMLLVGFRGQSVSSRHEIVRDIQKYKIGSVILFEYDALKKTRARNIGSPSQLTKLTADLQAYAQIPLFISIDEEGGLVSRLKSRYGFKTFPSQAKVAAKGDLSYTYDNALGLSSQLSEHGVNMNFAPVVDVNVNPRNPIIGKLGRSFSQDAERVTDHAREVIHAHRDNQVATALKHFPGHGSSTKDSHLSLVDVTKTWSQKELIPFTTLSREDNVDMIMTAHVFNRRLDRQYPATLSSKIIGSLLREKIGFNGVVISDDMNMKAIANHYSLDTAVELAIKAGVDILLFGNNIDYDKNIAKKVHKIVKRLIRQRKLSEERLDQSVMRILKLKEKRGLL